MNARTGTPSQRFRLVTAKAAYSKGARKRLVESRAKIDGVQAAIKHAIATGSLQPSDKLEHAQQAMDTRLRAAEARLKTLQKSSENEWEELRGELEDAWEDLSHSISSLVARVRDEST